MNDCKVNFPQRGIEILFECKSNCFKLTVIDRGNVDCILEWVDGNALKKVFVDLVDTILNGKSWDVFLDQELEKRA